MRSWPARRALLQLRLVLLALATTSGCEPAGPGAGGGTRAASPLRVAVDVGHGRESPGARSARGVGEFFFNRDLARQLAAQLEQISPSLTPLLVAADGVGPSPRRRARIAEEAGAAALVSIHHDSVQPRYLETWVRGGEVGHYSDRFRGYSLFYSARHRDPAASRELAFAVGRALRDAGFAPSIHHAEPIEGEQRPLEDAELGVYRFDDLRVLRTAAMPAVLVEAGVLVHRQEELLLADPESQKAMAAAMARGVQAFLQPGAAGATRPRSAP